MEVHHHSHHPKKWKEYITEFLMLFLAVTLGFFAENVREHQIEKSREVQLMKSMVSDLNKNESLLKNQLNALTARKISCDSLAYLLNSKNSEKYGADIYMNARRLGFYGREYPLASRSLDQLKNSGMFRLIEFNDVADSLSHYDNLKTQYEQAIKWFFEDVKNVQNENKILFDSHVFEESTIYHNAYKFTPIRPMGNPQLLTKDKEQLEKYYNSIYYLKRNTEVVMNIVDDLITNTQKMKALIVAKYKF
jgi:hypothetical protein